MQNIQLVHYNPPAEKHSMRQRRKASLDHSRDFRRTTQLKRHHIKHLLASISQK
eukprot:Gb_04101 [translate_table: standard]